VRGFKHVSDCEGYRGHNDRMKEGLTWIVGVRGDSCMTDAETYE